MCIYISGCENLHVIDGIWKIVFTTCAMHTEVGLFQKSIALICVLTTGTYFSFIYLFHEHCGRSVLKMLFCIYCLVELPDFQLEKLNRFHTNAIKSLLGLPSVGPTPPWYTVLTGLVYHMLPIPTWSHILWRMPNAWWKLIIGLLMPRLMGVRMETAQAIGTKNINTWLTKLVVLQGRIGQNAKKWSKHWLCHVLEKLHQTSDPSGQSPEVNWGGKYRPHLEISFLWSSFGSRKLAIHASIDFLVTFSNLKTFVKEPNQLQILW